MRGVKRPFIASQGVAVNLEEADAVTSGTAALRTRLAGASDDPHGGY
jgi:hypothetical protein